MLTPGISFACFPTLPVLHKHFVSFVLLVIIIPHSEYIPDCNFILSSSINIRRNFALRYHPYDFGQAPLTKPLWIFVTIQMWKLPCHPLRTEHYPRPTSSSSSTTASWLLGKPQPTFILTSSLLRPLGGKDQLRTHEIVRGSRLEQTHILWTTISLCLPSHLSVCEPLATNNAPGFSTPVDGCPPIRWLTKNTKSRYHLYHQRSIKP